MDGCEGLIPATPPKEAIESRRKQANQAAHGDRHHTAANPATGGSRANAERAGALSRVSAGPEDATAAAGEKSS